MEEIQTMNIKTLYCVPVKTKFIPTFFQNFLTTRVIRNNIKFSLANFTGCVSIRYKNLYLTFNKSSYANPLKGREILVTKLDEQSGVIFIKDYININEIPAMLYFADDYDNQYIYDPNSGFIHYGNFLDLNDKRCQHIQKTDVYNMLDGSEDPILHLIYNFIGYNGGLPIPDILLKNIINAIQDKYYKSHFVLDIILELLCQTVTSTVYNNIDEISEFCSVYETKGKTTEDSTSLNKGAGNAN
jgi:hypothetical protein